MKYIVTNIEYDIDNEIISLPDTLEIEIPNELKNEYDINEFISDKISNITNFCHKGFSASKK